jgi:hypothetical protein
MAVLPYRFELRRGDEVVATGHLSRDEPVEVGERIVVGRRSGSCAASIRFCASWSCGLWWRVLGAACRQRSRGSFSANAPNVVSHKLRLGEGVRYRTIYSNANEANQS